MTQGEPNPPVRRLAVLTTGRQDWGILRSTCDAVLADPALVLELVVGGTHLSVRHGETIRLIERDGFSPAAALRWLDGDIDPPPDVQAASALEEVGGYLRSARPDALLLVGDRFETMAAALAATVCLVPIAHLHGGEQSLGAFDDALRHAITKLAHLHLVSGEVQARRVTALGEDPASIHVVGAPGLDAARAPDVPDRASLERDLRISLEPPVVVVTVHPATLEPDPSAAARAVADAMTAVDATYVVTLPNADPGSAEVRAILTAAARGERRIAVDALGSTRYWGLLAIADAMLGNSSSGLIEAPLVRLPVVNVGDRQAGRDRRSNVIDVPADGPAIAAALRQTLEPGARTALTTPDDPLADGRAGARIADIIAAWRPSRPPRKPPVRIPPGS